MRTYVDNLPRIKLGRGMGWALSLVMLLLIVCGTRETYSQWAKHSFTHDGTSRDYWVFLPHNVQPKMPVVFSLHGFGSTFEFHRDYTLMHEVADSAGFVLVCPMGVALRWNSGAESGRHNVHGDDVGFISRIVDTLYARYDVDLGRIYCCGFSMGGEMTYRLACELGERFAAVASVAGCLNPMAVDLSWHPIRPMSLMHIHGTLDTEVPYEGNRPGFSTWSAPETMRFWIRGIGCPSQPETVEVADIVPGDSCTAQEIIWRDCADQTQIIHYRIIRGGHAWPGSGPSAGFEGYKNRDISANLEIWNFFKGEVNPLLGLAHGERIEVHPGYLSLREDSLLIAGSIQNPESHPVTIYALIEGIETPYKDSLELFDDGNHGDGGAADNAWGGTRRASGLAEETYRVSLITYDGSLGTRHRLHKSSLFTTVGPVIVEGYTVISTDTAAFPGKILDYRISVKNLGTTATAYDVTAVVTCSDTTVAVQRVTIPYGDLAPGQSSTGSAYQKVMYKASCHDGQVVEFSVALSSKGTIFWTDTFTDLVTGIKETERNLPLAYELEQNYPNPFNPSTTIGYGLPEPTHVTLTVFNTLGQQVAMIVQGEQEAGYHEVQFDANRLASGVYLYRLQVRPLDTAIGRDSRSGAGDFVQVRKLIHMK